MNAGQLNRIVTFETWTFTQDDKGNSIGTVTDSWQQRAHVKDRSGRPFIDESQQQWESDTEVTVRVSSKPVTPANTMVYEGFRYKINSVGLNSEGHKKFYIPRCSKTDVWVGLN